MHRGLPKSSDAQLLRQWRNGGDEAAFAHLVARHADAVKESARRRLRDEAAGDDASQAAWVVLAHRPRSAAVSARLHGSLEPWLRRTAALCARTLLRSQQRRRRHEQVASRPDQTSPADAAHAAHAELTEAVASAVARLPRRERRLVTLRYLEERPWPEIARLTDTTPAAARKAANRASARLRVLLRRSGITAAPPALAAAFARIAAAGRFAPPHVLPTLLAQRVLLMLNLKTLAVLSVAALTVVGGGAWLSQGNTAIAAEGVAPATLLVAQATTRPGEEVRPVETVPPVEDVDEAMVESLNDDPGALAGLPPESFRLLHGEPPRLGSLPEINFVDTPLVEVIAFLEESAGVQIDLHVGALRLEGVDPNVPITLRVAAPARFDQVMQRVLLQVGGGFAEPRFVWRFGTFLITTSDAVEQLDTSVTHDLAELEMMANLSTGGNQE